MTVQEQADALLARHIRHTDLCVTDDGITDCSCLMVERGDRMRDALDALIASVRAEEADRLRALEAELAWAVRRLHRYGITSQERHEELAALAGMEPLARALLAGEEGR